jgi:Na+-transporting NADH:ubiquinone oxidoreductase subunit NqrA
MLNGADTSHFSSFFFSAHTNGNFISISQCNRRAIIDVVRTVFALLEESREQVGEEALRLLW